MSQPIFAIALNTIPNCLPSGTLTLYPHQQRIASKFSTDLLANGGHIEKQVICTTPIYAGMMQLCYAVSDYAAIRTLRQQGLPVAAIGSGTLLCCPERNQIILQRRNATAAIAPNKLSSFGGHFTLDRKALGYGMLLDTLIAELREEANCDLLQLNLNLPTDLPPLYFIIEPKTGGVQFTPLAFALTPDQVDQLHGSDDEGMLESYHLVDDLELLLDPSHWSIMGYACFSTWRDLGFPVQKNWQGSGLRSAS